MRHVIYRIDGDRSPRIAEYDSAGAAKGALKRKWLRKYPDAKVASFEDFKANVVKKIKVRSLSGGAECEIDSDCPRSCDPSSELYWSM